MDELSRSIHNTTILVGELGMAEREELVRSRFENAEDAAAVGEKIPDRAGGNPFYIQEILESLGERGILSQGENGLLRWVKRDEAIAVPTTVEQVVASRLDRLPDDERDVIRR